MPTIGRQKLNIDNYLHQIITLLNQVNTNITGGHFSSLFLKPLVNLGILKNLIFTIFRKWLNVNWKINSK